MTNEDWIIDRIVEHLQLHSVSTRRGFLRSTMGVAVALPIFTALGPNAPLIALDHAEGLVVADTTRCVGCGRCELACTEFTEGKAQPSIASIKVARNYDFGPRGQQAGGRAMGEFGNFRVVQDTCLQCPPPAPCVSACPSGAIVTDNTTKAKIIDRKKCTGCRVCEYACPWEMISFDKSAKKAVKCSLCNGKPECVDACPTMALRYVSWRDLSRAVPIRQATPRG
jgi:Fe-S-cluster-containing dehydrogenase component